jgi:hypothetical protein
MLPIRKSISLPTMRKRAIAVELRVPQLGIWFAAVAATVRTDGIFLSTYQELAEGTRVEVQIALPDGPAVDLTGVVAEHPFDGPGIDIAFDDLDPDVRERIEGLSPVSEIRVSRLESVTHF